MNPQTESKPLAAIYSRTAVADETALAAQLAQCQVYCQTNGLNVVIEIRESGFNGNNLNRPGLNKLRELVKAGEVNIIVIKSLDRLSRRVDQVTELLGEIEQAGVCLKLTKGN